MIDSPHTTIGDVVDALAAQHPNAPALLSPDRPALTFGDLARQMHAVRACLQGLEIAPGDIVASVILGRPEMAAVCATLPCAATLAPLSPAFAPELYSRLLERLRPKAILVEHGSVHPLRFAARERGIAEIELHGDAQLPAGTFTLQLTHGNPQHARRGSARPEFAYVMTTAGTTGQPKLVPVSHRQMLLRTRTMVEWLALRPGEIAMNSMPMHHAHGLRMALMIPLLGGCTVACMPESDVEAFFEGVEEFRPHYLTAGFSFYRAVLRRAPEWVARLDGARVRLLRYGSGALRPDEIDRVEQLFRAPLLAGLSSTESCGIAHDPLPPRPRKRGSVGLPLNGEVATVDEQGRFLPRGATGELVVRGPTVFDGYFDDPELTAKSFVGDWFRSGDLGRVDEDGFIYFTGRVKDVINRGGEKIGPMEIDLALESIAGVREAAAFALPHPTLGEELVAAVVREPGTMLTESELIDQARARLVARHVPRRIFLIESLPRGEGGKVLRKALSERLGASAVGDARAPSLTTDTVHASPLEAAVSGLWQALLHVDSVKRTDDFFLVGGDSLSGGQLIAQVKSMFGVHLTLPMLFGPAATVSGMATAIQDLRNSSTPRLEDAAIGLNPPLDAQLVTAVCSHSQRRLWFLDRLTPGSTAYNQVRVLRIVGDLDVPRLGRALQSMIERHEILRTRFPSVDGEPLQRIDVDAKVPLEVTDFSALADAERAAAIATVLDTEAHCPFDLEIGPMLRFFVLRPAPNEHLFVRVWHHIVSDGWSAGLFERGLAATYNALGRDADASFPSPPLQYRDYARWQRARLDEAAIATQLDYWKAQLREIAPLPLPTDRPRPALSSDRGDVVTIALPVPLGRGMLALARAEHATPYMTLLTAFAALLHRLSETDDVAIGTPIAGRPRVEFESMPGFFANTLVLRTDLSGNPTFRQLLRRVRETALTAFVHQDIPFERVVEAVAPVRDPGRNPLFQVAFALEHPRGPPLPLDGVAVTRVRLPQQNSKFDITLTLRDRDGQLEGHWEYSTDLFDRATIERMAACYEALVQGVVGDADQPIASLPLLSPAERERVVRDWSGADRTPSPVEMLVPLFERQAALAAEQVAVSAGAGTLTYGALNASANQLAHHLTQCGVAPGSIVGIAFERDLPMIVAMLAILKAGAAYLPIDPQLPVDRIAFMLADAAARGVVTEQRFVERLPARGIEVFAVDRDAARIRGRATTDPAIDEAPAALAYVMYTSGSTGKPKGVAIRRQSVVALVRKTNYVALSAADVVAQLSHAAFDAATFEIFGALLNGSRLVILSRDKVLSAPAFLRARREHALTVVFLTTSLFNNLARERADCFAGLPSLLFGGEAADGDAVRRVLAADPPQRLVNGYGPTETTTFATFHVVQPNDASDAIPIGRPIRGAEVYVLDAGGELAPPGIVGELYIGGSGVGAGYVGHAEASNARFVAHPFRADSRVFRTGDRVRWLHDGRLAFIGRDDDQVKIRGFRVEPAEVRDALSRHPAIAACHVMSRRQASGDFGLTAYVVPKVARDAAASSVALRRHLAACLPVYMLPATIVTLDALPQFPSGKVDVAALPDPMGARPTSAQRHAPPRNDVERKLCELWRELLGLERIGIDDDFFELGGHSLLAAQLFARLDTRFQSRLPLRALFETPTVRALAARVDSQSSDGSP